MNSEEMLDNTIACLKVIGMVQKNGRLSVRKGQLSIETDDHLQKIRRWFNKDSRDLALMHIKNTVNNAVKLSKGLSDNSIDIELKSWAIQRLATEMQNCQNGIVNLKTTYCDDSLMVANLDVITERLQAHYNELVNSVSMKAEKEEKQDKQTVSKKDKHTM